MEKRKSLRKTLKKVNINNGYTLIEVLIAISIFLCFSLVNIHLLSRFLKEFHRDNNISRSTALMGAALNYIDALIEKAYYVGYDGNSIIIKFKEYRKGNSNIIDLKDYRIVHKSTNTINVQYFEENKSIGDNVICRNIKNISVIVKGGCLYVEMEDENNISAIRCFIIKNMALP